jgi:hypothetical protein
VRGTNEWHRERLSDSEIHLHPETPGTAVEETAASPGDGQYAAAMTLASVPERNTVAIEGTHFPPLIRYVGAYGGEVDPATVDPDTLEVERVRDPARPVVIQDSFSLWGVAAAITGVDPTPVFLGDGGTVTRPSIVQHEILPPEYRALLEPRDVRLDLNSAANDSTVLTGSGVDPRPFEIPAGLALPAGEYYARLRLRGVSAGGADLASEKLALPVCSLLDLETPVVELKVVRDPLNGGLGGKEARIRFSVCRASTVSLSVGGETLRSSIDGATGDLLETVDAVSNHTH